LAFQISQFQEQLTALFKQNSINKLSIAENINL